MANLPQNHITMFSYEKTVSYVFYPWLRHILTADLVTINQTIKEQYPKMKYFRICRICNLVSTE